MALPFSQTSLLFGLRHDDPESIRRVMDGVLRRFASVPREHPSQLHNLDAKEFNIVDKIIKETVDNVLVRNAAFRFAVAHRNRDDDVYQFAREFDIVVAPSVLGSADARDTAVVEQNRAIFQNLAENGPDPLNPSYIRVYHSGYKVEDDHTVLNNDADVDVNGEELSVGKKGQKTPAKESKAVVKDNTPVKENTPAKGKAAGKGKRAAKSPRVDGKPPRNLPKKPRDFTVINDGQDRTLRAVLGEPNESLFVLRFNCEKEVKPGVVVRGPEFLYDHRDIWYHEFDWNSKDHVNHLNSWRQQIFIRHFGPMRETRYQYTVQERDELYRILGEHLSTPEVGGRYKQVNWKVVTNKLNDHFCNHKFKKGEPVAQTRYPKGSNGWVSSDINKTVPPHTYIEREPSGVQNQMAHFTDEKCIKLIAAAKKVDEQYFLNLVVDGKEMPKVEAKKRAHEEDEDLTPSKMFKSGGIDEKNAGDIVFSEAVTMSVLSPKNGESSK